jgi:hypothetical protein
MARCSLVTEFTAASARCGLVCSWSLRGQQCSCSWPWLVAKLHDQDADESSPGQRFISRPVMLSARQGLTGTTQRPGAHKQDVSCFCTCGPILQRGAEQGPAHNTCMLALAHDSTIPAWDQNKDEAPIA